MVRLSLACVVIALLAGAFGYEMVSRLSYHAGQFLFAVFLLVTLVGLSLASRNKPADYF